QALQLIPPMCRDRRVRMHGKAVHTHTPRTGELWRLPLVATASANAPNLLAGLLPEGYALLDRGRHGAGERWFVVELGVISGGHTGVHACLQISQPTQLTDDKGARATRILVSALIIASATSALGASSRHIGVI